MSTPKPPPNVVFCGGGTVGSGFLQHLVALRDAGRCRLAGVLPSHLSEEREPLLAGLVAAHAVPLLSSLDDLLAIADLDLVLSAGNHKRFGAVHIRKARRGIINFHAAPLPRYRGSACPAFAILNNEISFGVTFHLIVDEDLDAGPILYVEHFPIGQNDTAGDIDRRCIEVGISAFIRCAEQILGMRK